MGRLDSAPVTIPTEGRGFEGVAGILNHGTTGLGAFVQQQCVVEPNPLKAAVNGHYVDGVAVDQDTLFQVAR
jgi:hypothetical protein